MSLMPLATIRLTPPKIDPLRWASLCGLWLLSGCATIAPGSAVTDVEFIVQGKLLLTLADEKTALQFSWQQNQIGHLRSYQSILDYNQQNPEK